MLTCSIQDKDGVTCGKDSAISVRLYDKLLRMYAIVPVCREHHLMHSHRAMRARTTHSNTTSQGA